jgi:hypothetical protein
MNEENGTESAQFPENEYINDFLQCTDNIPAALYVSAQHHSPLKSPKIRKNSHTRRNCGCIKGSPSGKNISLYKFLFMMVPLSYD